MLEGLLLLRRCPRCGGELQTVRFTPDPGRHERVSAQTPPHLVLGIPRPSRLEHPPENA